MVDTAQEDVLLALLNTTPVVKGAEQDLLAEPAAARAWQREHGGDGSEQERRHLVRARDLLQDVIRDRRPAAALEPLLDGVGYRPRITDGGVAWELDAPEGHRPGVLAVLAWGELRERRPGRLRPCANPECRLYLLDRSKTNKARWCSMAVCGNRMKARRHYERVRQTAG